MMPVRERSDPIESESSTDALITRTVAGHDIAVVQSVPAAVDCIQLSPSTVVLDLTQVSVSNRRFTRWFLNMTDDSHRVLITGNDRIPVAPILVDGWVEKPLTDKKLETILDRFACRDRYATILAEYTECADCSETTVTNRIQILEKELSTLQAKLKNMSETNIAFARTMREILQTEQNL